MLFITIKRVVLLSIIVTYILIVFGGYVASSESGMGCGPEWPLCNGEVIPELKGDTLIEFAHRVIGLFLVLIAVILYRLIRKLNTDRLRAAGNWMIGILTFQVLAGAVVVILDLPTIVVTTHLLTAMLFMFSLLWIYRINQRSGTFENITHQKTMIHSLNLVLVLVLVTIGLGAYIKHMHYGLACEWFACEDSWLPTTGPQLFQTLHRWVAFITVAYILLLTGYSYWRKWGRVLQSRLFIASFIILIQLLSGVFTVITNISIPWAVIHLALGTVLFMVVADTRVSLGVAITGKKSDFLSNYSGRRINK
ncbi:COX15/CtaA family protein [Cytobacillus suaedae]|nr:COX15/CtaA family protein [Cytobacillus suaedae]